MDVLTHGRGPRRVRSRAAAAAAVVALALVGAACGSSSGSSAHSGGSAGGSKNASGGSDSSRSSTSSGGSSALTISDESGNLWTCNLNPFNPSVYHRSLGFFYEPLEQIDSLESGKATPWLATSSSWSKDDTVLTFTTRSGVKWSDGKPFSAADVAFTFNLMKKFPALDLPEVWTVLKSVTAEGSDKVVFTFKQPSASYFFYVAGEVPIVPEHIWAGIHNPVTYTDMKPVGTGPYVLQKCTPQNVEYTKNTSYWQPGLPKVTTVNYPAFTSNTPSNEYLSTGQAQWGGQFIPNVQAVYQSKNPGNQYWYPPVSNVDLFINQTVAPLNNLAVRQAMAYAIDRPKVSSVGEYGYEPAANQTGIVLPTFKSWYDSPLAGKYNYSYNPGKAVKVLEAAGFKKGSNGIFVAPDGKPLSFTLMNNGGASDWVASAQVVINDLKAVGISVTPENLSSTAYDNDVFTGKYQLAYGSEDGGPTPYYELRDTLFSPDTAPIGQVATTNYERYKSAATDKLINAYSSTTDVAKQHQIIDGLEQVMLSQIPVIPVTESVEWYQYNTSDFSGWPTKSDPYALPDPGSLPDSEVVLVHLEPK